MRYAKCLFQIMIASSIHDPTADFAVASCNATGQKLVVTIRNAKIRTAIGRSPKLKGLLCSAMHCLELKVHSHGLQIPHYQHVRKRDRSEALISWGA